MSSDDKFLPALQNYLQVSKTKCEAQLAHLDTSLPLQGVSTTVRLHYVHFNPNHEPKFEDLARLLVRHIIRYVLSMSTRDTITKQLDEPLEGDLFIKARDFFRKIDTSGEVGELLLFCLLESVLMAPQMICKMELKTNSKDEVKGSDGIHMNWNDAEKCLNVFIGESKLYTDIGDALDSVFDSVNDFIEKKRQQEELGLVTSHFKHATPGFRDEVHAYLSGDHADKVFKITYACLVGWDWKKYAEMATSPEKFKQEFTTHYASYKPNIVNLLEHRIKKHGHSHLNYQFFFIPFQSVQAFRDHFYRILRGD